MIAGIDIAKNKHWAQIIYQGDVVGKPFPAENIIDDFKNLVSIIETKQKQLRPTNIIVGMEPTGVFFDRPWFLWGALYYSLVSILAFTFKKNWPVDMFILIGIIFHANLIYNGYLITNAVCVTCLGFWLTEVVSLITYMVETKKPIENFLAFGPGKAALMVAVVIFIMSPVKEPVNMAVASVNPPEQPTKIISEATGVLSGILGSPPRRRFSLPDQFLTGPTGLRYRWLLKSLQPLIVH